MKRVREHRQQVSRAFLVGTGLVLLVLAVLGAALATGAVDQLGDHLRADGPVLDEGARQAMLDDEAAWQLAAFVLGILLLVLSWLWLRAQLPPVRHQKDALVAPGDKTQVPGRNVVDGGALAELVERRLERSDGVERARAEIHLDEGLVRLRLDVDGDMGIDTVAASVNRAVEELTTVVQHPTAPRVEVDMRTIHRDIARVT